MADPLEHFHRSRESGIGCPGAEGGPHYFAFIDPTVNGRVCIDCGDREPPISETGDDRG